MPRQSWVQPSWNNCNYQAVPVTNNSGVDVFATINLAASTTVAITIDGAAIVNMTTDAAVTNAYTCYLPDGSVIILTYADGNAPTGWKWIG